MSAEFDPNALAAEVLFTSDLLQSITNPEFVDEGTYHMKIVGYKEFLPKEIGKKGVVIYNVEVLRCLTDPSATRWPRQQIKFFPTELVEEEDDKGNPVPTMKIHLSDESRDLWSKLVPEMVKNVRSKEGDSVDNWLKLVREACSDIPFIATVTHRERQDGSGMNQRIRVMART